MKKRTIHVSQHVCHTKCRYLRISCCASSKRHTEHVLRDKTIGYFVRSTIQKKSSSCYCGGLGRMERERENYRIPGTHFGKIYLPTVLEWVVKSLGQSFFQNELWTFQQDWSLTHYKRSTKTCIRNDVLHFWWLLIGYPFDY